MTRHGRAENHRHTDTELDDTRHLVTRAQTGDVDAWETLYRRLHPQMTAFARRRLPAPHLADDVVSEAMARALAKLDSFAWSGAGFDAWMIGIVRNVVSESTRSFAKSAELRDDPHEGEPGPLAALVDAERRNDLRTAFGRLDDDERELLELRTVAKLSAAGAGQILNMSAGAVRTAQSRALQRLRTFFEEVNGEH